MIQDFRTPRGTSVQMEVRPDTNDHNTLNSCLTEDEYGLRDLHLTGHALDIGAYTGGVTVALLVDNPELRVVAVEPVPDNVVLLLKNLALNELGDRVVVLQAAAGAKGQKTEGVAWNWRQPGGPLDETMQHHRFVGGSTLALDNPDIAHDEVQTASWSVTSLLKLAGTAEFAFAKVDCEGCEAKFLTDPAVARIARITGEWHPWYLDEEGVHRLLDATHEVTTWGTGPGGFTAMAR